MVLHDNKWDRKAKRAYQKKHGLTPERPVEAPTQKWSRKDADLELGSSDGESDSSKSAHETEGGESDSNVPETQTRNAQHTVASSEPTEMGFELPVYQNAEEDDIIRQHIARVKAEAASQKKTYRSHVQVVSDPTEFDKIQSNVQGKKLENDLRRRFGKARKSYSDDPNGADDADFDEFMENVETSRAVAPQASETTRFSIDASKQKWLDDLLG